MNPRRVIAMGVTQNSSEHTIWYSLASYSGQNLDGFVLFSIIVKVSIFTHKMLLSVIHINPFIAEGN